GPRMADRASGLRTTGQRADRGSVGREGGLVDQAGEPEFLWCRMVTDCCGVNERPMPHPCASIAAEHSSRRSELWIFVDLLRRAKGVPAPSCATRSLARRGGSRPLV